MRYANGGGLTAEGRARREDVQLQAASMFKQDMDARRIARILRVSTAVTGGFNPAGKVCITAWVGQPVPG